METVGKQINSNFYHDEIANAYHSTDDMSIFADNINAYNPKFVIDAGCGQNIWKGKVNNLVGFDHSDYPNIDHQLNYEEYDNAHNPTNADFVFCLGSIHRGEQDKNPREECLKNLEYVHKWLKPGGIAVMRVRCDVELAYKNKQTPERRFLHLWSMADIVEWQQRFGFRVVKPIEMRMVTLDSLSDSDLLDFEAKFDDPRQQQIIQKEKSRRKAGEPVIVPSVLKAWYIWWWQKR